MTPCPCARLSPQGRARPLPFGDCCGRWRHSDTPAPDAESLMRSRYSAFVHEDADWLMATWHASTRPAQVVFEPGARWLGLQVRRCQAIGADQAEVEFVARYRVAGRAVRLHETSRFVREGIQWFYVDGMQHER